MTEASEPRRLPAPWRVIEKSESFVVEDAKGQPLAYVYFEDEPVRRGLMNRLTSDEAWRVASKHRKTARIVEEELAPLGTAKGGSIPYVRVQIIRRVLAALFA